MGHSSDDTSHSASSTPRNGILGIPGLCALAVLTADQLTKILFDVTVPIGWSRPVIPGFFDLVHWRNTGAAWGIFNEHTWLLGVVSLLCLVALIFFFDKLSERKRLPSLLLGALAGGIAGNMLDRLFRSSVIDFLDFHWKDIYHYPAFNVADMAICISICLLVLLSFLNDRKHRSAEKAS